jgi:hypothetical protein
MRNLKLIFLLFLIMPNIYALVIYQDGKLIKTYSRKNFVEITKEKKVNFYNYHNNKKSKYIGIPLDKIMEDAGIEPDKIEEVVFKCLNGYEPFLNFQLFKNREAIVTYKSASGGPFTRFSQKTKKIIDLGPYYLVWKLEDLHFSQRSKYSSIYKIQAIDFKSSLFTLPFEKNYNIDGFNTYKRYCISCHKINNKGGTISSELLDSKYLEDISSFINYVVNPTKMNPESQMLAFPKFSNQFIKVKNIYQMLSLLKKNQMMKNDLSPSELKDIKKLLKKFNGLSTKSTQPE